MLTKYISLQLALALAMITPSLTAVPGNQPTLKSRVVETKNRVVKKCAPLLKKCGAYLKRHAPTITIATGSAILGAMLHSFFTRKKSKSNIYSLSSLRAVPLEEYQECNAAILESFYQLEYDRSHGEHKEVKEILKKAWQDTIKQLADETQSLLMFNNLKAVYNYKSLIDIKHASTLSPSQIRLFLYNILLCTSKQPLPSRKVFDQTLHLFDLGRFRYGLPIIDYDTELFVDKYDAIIKEENDFLEKVYKKLSKE